MSKLKSETKVLITNARLSYPRLFVPYTFDDKQNPKYSASLVISKDDTDTIDLIKQAIENAFEKGKPKFSGKKKSALNYPLRDGDTDRPDDEVYKNAYFLNANSKNRPDVVDKYLDPKTKKPVVLTEEEVYPGCYVNATINFYPYAVRGNAGIAAGLGNVQKVKDGKRLGGATSAGQDFSFEEALTFDLDDTEAANGWLEE